MKLTARYKIGEVRERVYLIETPGWRFYTSRDHTNSDTDTDNT